MYTKKIKISITQIPTDKLVNRYFMQDNERVLATIAPMIRVSHKSIGNITRGIHFNNMKFFTSALRSFSRVGFPLIFSVSNSFLQSYERVIF